MTDPSLIDRLTEVYADQLRRNGEVRAHYSDDTQRDQLREAGRRAGRQLNRPVRTFAQDGTVLVVLTDWGTNPLEARLSEVRANRLIERVFPDRDN